MTKNKQWKAHERTVASRAGTKRTPLSGINSGHETHSDSLSDDFYIEAKYTGNPKSMFYLPAREVRKAERAIHVIYDDMDLVVFQTNKPENGFIFIDLEEKKRWRNWGIWSFFLNDVCLKADAENKIPLLNIRIKNKHGEVVICKLDDYLEVEEISLWPDMKK
ncbi:hypothetical protein [Acinetobacter sp.]|uniref:hypothetical protein n=1 Tax=Acinetobacter sp. TaxID=472 RepID=UPI003D000C59